MRGEKRWLEALEMTKGIRGENGKDLMGARFARKSAKLKTAGKTRMINPLPERHYGERNSWVLEIAGCGLRNWFWNPTGGRRQKATVTESEKLRTRQTAKKERHSKK